MAAPPRGSGCPYSAPHSDASSRRRKCEVPDLDGMRSCASARVLDITTPTTSAVDSRSTMTMAAPSVTSSTRNRSSPTGRREARRAGRRCGLSLHPPEAAAIPTADACRHETDAGDDNDAPDRGRHRPVGPSCERHHREGQERATDDDQQSSSTVEGHWALPSHDITLARSTHDCRGPSRREPHAVTVPIKWSGRTHVQPGHGRHRGAGRAGS